MEPNHLAGTELSQQTMESMMNSRIFANVRHHLLAISLIALAGCGAADVLYDTLVSDYDETLALLRTSTETHGQTITNEADMDTMMTEEDAHYADMQDLMTTMTDTTDTLSGCDDLASMDFSETMGMMTDEVSSHYQEMSDATTVEEMHSLEESHQADMNSLMDTMSDMNMEMSQLMGSSMNCGSGM